MDMDYCRDYYYKDDRDYYYYGLLENLFENLDMDGRDYYYKDDMDYYYYGLLENLDKDSRETTGGASHLIGTAAWDHRWMTQDLTWPNHIQCSINIKKMGIIK